MLYIVGTPIGNLDDISLRQARTLAASDIILAEDTRSARILIQGIQERFNVVFRREQKIISYYRESEFDKLPSILDWLKNNETISLISESGLPLFSDPGLLLVKILVRKHIPFTVVPGPSSFATAVIHAGFNSANVLFVGFLPKKHNEIALLLRKLKEMKQIMPKTVIVFYESAKRLSSSLFIMVQEIGWDPEIAICRELTKLFEEIVRGKANCFVKRQFKGELTVVIS